MITAEKVYKEILEMPIKERERLFTVIARRGFEKDTYTHNEVFDDIRHSPFIIKEAAEYLEVAEITVTDFYLKNLAHQNENRYQLKPCVTGSVASQL